MQCPVDGNTLLLSERQGVEIDYCPQCRGVWLDRGELDKLLERDEAEWRADRGDDRDRERSGRGRHDDDDDDRFERRDDRSSGSPRKKKRWLSEVFEFGGD